MISFGTILLAFTPAAFAALWLSVAPRKKFSLLEEAPLGYVFFLVSVMLMARSINNRFVLPVLVAAGATLLSLPLFGLDWGIVRALAEPLTRLLNALAVAMVIADRPLDLRARAVPGISMPPRSHKDLPRS